ncbi:Keratin, type II cytoskeletal 74 [Apodemus speciosus]|uniref:Keratin, type II cytoskeletal 74 n=1 Tax=Apodemus speciosus TaxID=105296 RepID=A0ABQ0FKV9_APOSI
MDDNQDLDLDSISAEVHAHYEDFALKTRPKRRHCTRPRLAAGCHGDSLNHTRNEMLELNRLIQRICRGITNVKKQDSKVGWLADSIRITLLLAPETTAALAASSESITQGWCSNLETAIADAEQRRDSALKDARVMLDDLEGALQQAKEELAQTMREYQELMGLELSLDIEITTYRKLLEGEECRMSGEKPPSVNKSTAAAGTLARKTSR